MQTGKERMQWLDAMRGFTMILVVMYHVAHISFGIADKHSSCQSFLVLFRMPLFFFVSGFLAYKAGTLWNGSTLARLSLKKMKVQLIPTAVFLLVFTALCRTKFLDTLGNELMSPTKGGYWFTWVLLHMFLIYYGGCWLMHRLRISAGSIGGKVVMGAAMTVSVALYAVTYMPPLMKELPQGVHDFLNYSSLIQTIHYMQYFLLGNIVRRYWQDCQRLMDGRWCFVMVLLLAFLSTGDSLVWHNLKFMWRNLPLTIASYSLLLLVLMFFRHYKEWFNRDHTTGRVLQYIGTRTLDIYLLHYMFLPQMPMVGAWFKEYRHNFIPDFVLSLLMSLIVIAFCLLVSNLLRISPLLSEYLFGRRVEVRDGNK